MVRLGGCHGDSDRAKAAAGERHLLSTCVADPGCEKRHESDKRKREKAPHVSSFFLGPIRLSFSPLRATVEQGQPRIYEPITGPTRRASAELRAGHTRELFRAPDRLRRRARPASPLRRAPTAPRRDLRPPARRQPPCLGPGDG